ncbi:MAG: hypothetical protein R3B96_12685 [Pirellulaceae bacterium]
MAPAEFAELFNGRWPSLEADASPRNVITASGDARLSHRSNDH